MAQDATDAVDAATGGFDIASLTNPEALLGYAQSALPLFWKLLGAIVIYWIGMKIVRWVAGLAKKVLDKNPAIDATLANFLSSIVRYIGTALFIIIAITTLGVQTTSLVAMLGAATLAIGLALQGTLGNVAAGVMLMLFRPYKLGDYVDVAGQEGVVDDVNIFTYPFSPSCLHCAGLRVFPSAQVSALGQVEREFLREALFFLRENSPLRHLAFLFVPP